MHQQTLKRQQLTYLCDNLISAVVAVLLGVVIVGLVLRDRVDPFTLYAWGLAALLVAAFRLWTYFRIKNRLDQAEAYPAIEKLLIASAAATGVVWGAGSILFAMSTDMFYWVFLAFVLSGYASGAVFTTSASLSACAAYFFPTILPITFWLFLQDDSRAPLMGVLLLVFIAAAWNVARNANRMLLDKHALFAEKAALSDSLQQRNQQLKHEMEERKKTAAELAQSNARHLQLLTHAPIGMLVVRQGCVLFSNAYWRQLAQQDRAAEVKDITQLVCPDDRTVLTALLDADKQDSAQQQLQRPMRWSRGDMQALHTEVSALGIEYDGATATLLVVEDVEPRLKAEAAEHLKHESEAYAQRLAALQTMAGGIAHDFNNLLAAIICNTSLMRKTHGADHPELSRFIGRIEDASAQATRLSHQMLAYSGHGAFVVEPINLSTAISDMQKQLNALTDESTVIRYELYQHTPAIDADPGQISQMLENLISNASEAYHGEPGEVTVKTDIITLNNSENLTRSNHGVLPSGEYVSLHVRDTGCGMDGKTLHNIFDPFFSTKFTGRGLGMSAVFGIVRSLKGDICIESRPEEGSDIHILLPISRQPQRHSLQAQPEPARGKNLMNKGAVLFVDDEAILREAASEMLGEMGYAVFTACDGLDALDVYKQHASEIDVVILDLTMPRMGGKTCLKALYALNPQLCVILSSGYSVESISAQLDGCTPAAMLQKPYSAEMLERTIQSLQ